MSIKVLSAAGLAIAAMAVSVASASATTITKDSDGLAVGTNRSLLLTNIGTVSWVASWGSINCGSSSIGMNIDTDGTVDVGDVASASFSGCAASFGVTACVYPDNVSSWSGAITYNAATDPVHDIAVNATRNTIVINAVNSSCPASPRTTHQSSGCTIVVAGNLNGTFNEDTNVATLSNAPGLQVVSKSGTGFLCFSINTGTAATFNGSYTVSPGISVGP